MRNPQGYALVVGPDATEEADTFTCKHCQRVVKVPPHADPADMGGLCRQCDGLICPRCVKRGRCIPWEREMERREARAMALASYGL